MDWLGCDIARVGKQLTSLTADNPLIENPGSPIRYLLQLEAPNWGLRDPEGLGSTQGQGSKQGPRNWTRGAQSRATQRCARTAGFSTRSLATYPRCNRSAGCIVALNPQGDGRLLIKRPTTTSPYIQGAKRNNTPRCPDCAAAVRSQGPTAAPVGQSSGLATVDTYETQGLRAKPALYTKPRGANVPRSQGPGTHPRPPLAAASRRKAVQA